MDTETKLREMFTEEIIHYSGDSGGIYGYQYEKNKKDGISENQFIIASDTKDVDIYDIFFNTFYLLKENCEYMEDETKKLQKMGLDEWELNNGMDKLEDGYTYNLDLPISQDFLWRGYENMYGEKFLVIMLHNGCDARAGFTEPVLFQCDYPEEIFCATDELLYDMKDMIALNYNINIIGDD